MTRWVRMAVAAGAVGLLVSGCVLRPRYVDLMEGGEEGNALVVITDAASGQPLEGAQVSWGEGKDKVVLTTDEDGAVVVPRDERLLSQNPVVVITRPEGVSSIDIQSHPAPAEAATAPQPAAEPPPAKTPSVHIPEGGVGPGQPSDLNRPDEVPSPTPPPLPSEPPASSPDAGTSTAQ